MNRYRSILLAGLSAAEAFDKDRDRGAVLEHNHGRPIRTSALPPRAFLWRVQLPDGTAWEGIQARDVKECRKKLAEQIGKLPPGTRCARMKTEGV